jgi:type II secretory pathway pseudopilin PulG
MIEYLKNKKIQKGVTIVELIVYIGLLSIFMLVLVDVFVTILNAKLESESTSSLNQDARYIYSRLAYDVGNADSMTLPLNLGNTEGSLQVKTGNVTDTYSLDGSGNLNLYNGTTTMKLNGDDTTLTNLSFTRLGSPDEKPTVKVSFTIKSLVNLQSGEQSRTIDTTFGLRP